MNSISAGKHAISGISNASSVAIPTVHIPMCYPELSTSRVMTMEYVEGIKLSDTAALVEAGVDLTEIARTWGGALSGDDLREELLSRRPPSRERAGHAGKRHCVCSISGWWGGSMSDCRRVSKRCSWRSLRRTQSI
jgi:hypothetical protein